MSTGTSGHVAGAADPAAEERSIELLVFAEQVALLHDRAVVAQATVVVNASVVVAIFWERSPRVAAVVWLAALSTVAAARSLAVLAYRRRARAPSEARLWARIFVAGA